MMDRSITATIALAALTLVALLPNDADAAGFYLPGRGVAPMGRGGAYIASSGGDLNAIWYNPANLSLLEETQLTVDTAMVGTFSKFKRAPRTTRSGETETYDEISNSAFPPPIPQILVGGPTGLDGLSWSVGFFAPYATHQRFPEGGPQRYTLIDNSKSILAFLSASVAYQISDNFRIGAGFQNMIGSFELVTAISGYSGLYGRPEDRDLDILSRVTMRDLFAPTGNIGVWAGLSDHVEAALSAQLPATLWDDDAQLDVRMPSHPSFDNAEMSNDQVSGGLDLPMILRGAVRYTREDFDIELAGVFERWSVFDKITVQPNDIDVENVPGIGSIPVGAMGIPHNWNDTFSVRLGGHYRFSDQWLVRAGYAFETGAPPDKYYSVFAPDPNKHLIGGGMRHSWGNFQLDASIGYYAMANREITDSNVRQINPVDAEDELATVVGNGQYKTSILVVGTGLNWVF